MIRGKTIGYNWVVERFVTRIEMCHLYSNFGIKRVARDSDSFFVIVLLIIKYTKKNVISKLLYKWYYQDYGYAGAYNYESEIVKNLYF